MLTVREALLQYHLAQYGEPVITDDSELIEILQEEGTEVYRGSDIDMHRWYGRREVVKDFKGVFISFDEYVITGDHSMYDMGLKYSLEDMTIVQRKERVVTEIYYE